MKKLETTDEILTFAKEIKLKRGFYKKENVFNGLFDLMTWALC